MGVDFENFPFLHKRASFKTLATTGPRHWYSGSTVKRDILQKRENGNTSYIVEAKEEKLNSGKQWTRVLKGG